MALSCSFAVLTILAGVAISGFYTVALRDGARSFGDLDIMHRAYYECELTVFYFISVISVTS